MILHSLAIEFESFSTWDGGGIEIELLGRLHFYTHREMVTVDLTKVITSYI